MRRITNEDVTGLYTITVLPARSIWDKEVTVILDKKVFIEDYINYEYKEEDGIYIQVESTPEEKQRKRDEYKDRTDRDARDKDSDQARSS